MREGASQINRTIDFWMSLKK